MRWTMLHPQKICSIIADYLLAEVFNADPLRVYHHLLDVLLIATIAVLLEYIIVITIKASMSTATRKTTVGLHLSTI